MIKIKLPNGYGSIFKLSGKRRKPRALRITDGYKDKGTQNFKYIGYYESRPEAISAFADYNANPYDLSKRKLNYAEVYEKYCKKRYLDKDNVIPGQYVAAFNRSTNLHDMPFVEIRTKRQ